MKKAVAFQPPGTACSPPLSLGENPYGMSYAMFGVEIVHHLRDIIEGLKYVDLSLVPTSSPFWLNVKVTWGETCKRIERRVLNML